MIDGIDRKLFELYLTLFVLPTNKDVNFQKNICFVNRNCVY